jgi:hypothetical protein
MHTYTAIATSIDTAQWRIRTNTFTSMRMGTSISTRIRTNMSIGMSMSIRDIFSSRTIMLTIYMISNRMIIGTTRPDVQFGR